MFSLRLPPEEISKRQAIFISLPTSLKTAILSEETADKLYNISQRCNIKKEKTRIISFTAVEVMIGIIKLNEFANVLKSRLETDQATAEKLVQGIKQEIFQPVMTALIEVQQESFQEAPPKSKDQNVVDLKNIPKQ